MWGMLGRYSSTYSLQMMYDAWEATNMMLKYPPVVSIPYGNKSSKTIGRRHKSQKSRSNRRKRR